MGYTDPNTVSNPTTGQVAPAAWGDTVRDCLEFLIDRPQFVARHSGTQNVNTSSNKSLLADTEELDTDSMHSTSSNTGRGTVNTAGKYRVSAILEWDSDATGRREVYFLVNGATAHVVGVASAVSGGTQNVSKVLTLAATDYVEVRVWQNSGGTRTVTLQQFAMQHVAR